MPFNEGVHTELSLNLWAAGIDSKLKWKDQKTVLPDADPALYQAIGSPSFSDEAYTTTMDLLDAAEGIFIGSAQLYWNRWSVQADATYVSIEANSSQDLEGEIGLPDPGGTLLTGAVLDATQDTLHADLNVGYAITPEIELFAGARWTRVHALIEMTLDGELKETGDPISAGVDVVKSESDWVDPQVGIRLKSYFNEDYYLRAQADIAGLVGVQYAYQARAAVGYRAFDNMSIEAGYRLLKYHANDDEVRFTQLNQGFEGRLVFSF